MSLNKKSVDDINVKGRRVLVRCDFNVPLKEGKITDETRINAALPTIKKLINDGGKVILCSHLGKVKNGPNEGESLAPVAVKLSEKLGKDVKFISDYHVTGEEATKAVAEMNEGDVILLQNTRFRGAEETKNGEEFSKELADLADDYVCDAFGSSHRAHASVAGVTKFISAKGGSNVVGYLMQKEIDFLGNAVENPVRPFVAILGGAKVADIGMGSGILAICSKKFGASCVYGCDNDETVIDVAKENALKNHTECVFELNTADKINEKFDFVLANILHNVLAEIMGDLKAIMNDGAYMVLSGILDEKKPVVLEAVKKHNLHLIEEVHQDQWVALIVRKVD